MEYQFEKNKLYNFLGKDLIDKFKEYKCFIAGGTITSVFCNREINDIDVYFRSEKLLIKFIEECWEDSDWVNILTKKSVLVNIQGKDVQLIHFKYFDSAQEIFDTYDFTVCMGAFDFKTEQFELHNDFMRHNSQRILQFNKNTAFPIVSLMRVQKYKDKGYTISKPEFLRIAITCMDLKIDSVEALKDQMGGMYGINYDKLVQFADGEEFSLEKVVDKLENLALDEDYFKRPEEIKFEDVEEVISVIKKVPVKVVTIHNKKYKITYENLLKPIKLNPPFYVEVSAEEYFKDKKFYKFVLKQGNNYCSHHDQSFVYVVGKVAKPKNEHLYFCEKNEIVNNGYYNTGSMLEVTIPHEDFSYKDGSKIHAKSCLVLREVPKEEYDLWKSEEEDNCPFEL